jgi:hypothetical protein
MHCHAFAYLVRSRISEAAQSNKTVQLRYWTKTQGYAGSSLSNVCPCLMLFHVGLKQSAVLQDRLRKTAGKTK